MKNKTLYIHILLLGALFATTLKAQEFPYYTYGDVATEFTKLSATSGTATDVTFGRTDGVVLTTDQGNQYAGVYLKNLTFPTARGFEIEFEYNIKWGNSSMGAGDGFALVLFDSEAAREGKVQMGVAGAGLGYNLRNGSSTIPGFSNGYFGLGFDSYGNYKNRMTASNEWTNGLPSSYFDTDEKKRSHVTIRGPFYKDAAGRLNIKKGYPVLFTRSTIYKKADSKMYVLDSEGNYIAKDNSNNVAYLDLKNNKASNLLDTQNGYRKIVVQFLKGTSVVNSREEDGYYIFVDLFAYEGNQSYDIPLVENFFVKKSGSIKYPEYSSSGESRRPTIDNLYYTIPSVLRLAFTASTGGAYQRQSIRNIKVRVPYSPQTSDMVVEKASRNETTTFDPLEKSVGYNTNVYNMAHKPVGSKDYLDLKSFRFKSMDAATGKFVFSSDPYEISSPIGTYNYNPMTGFISFEPTTVVPTTYVSDVVYFDIKNKPTTALGSEDISAEIFRSNTTKATLLFDDLNNRKYIIVNANPVQ